MANENTTAQATPEAAVNTTTQAEVNSTTPPPASGATTPVEPPKETKPESTTTTTTTTTEPPKADAVAKPVAPEKYELKLPEGSLLPPKQIEEVAAYAKSKGLSQDDAQAILEREHGAAASFWNTQLEALENKKVEWLDASKKDSEFGGAKFEENARLAVKAMDRFGTPELKQQLDKTGLGNHPDFLRVFVRIGKLMSDDKIVMPGLQGSPERKSDAELFFGSKTKKEA